MRNISNIIIALFLNKNIMKTLPHGLGGTAMTWPKKFYAVIICG